MSNHAQQFKLFTRSIVFFLVCGCSIALAQTTQDHIHHMGPSVMSFDIAKTTHVFHMTESGGVQRVIIKDASAKNLVAMIQTHLAHEAEAFQRGDYSDPVSLHGKDMPGLKELQAGAKQIIVVYSPLPNGAEINFITTNLHLLTAVHRWFGAQLSEHGADAMTE